MAPRRNYSICSVLLALLCIIILGGVLAIFFVPTISVNNNGYIVNELDGTNISSTSILTTYPETDVEFSLFDVTISWFKGDKQIEQDKTSMANGNITLNTLVKNAVINSYCKNNAIFIIFMILLLLIVLITIVSMVFTILSPFGSMWNKLSIIFVGIVTLLSIIATIIAFKYTTNNLFGLNIDFGDTCYSNILLKMNASYMLLGIIVLFVIAISVLVGLTIARLFNHQEDRVML